MAVSADQRDIEKTDVIHANKAPDVHSSLSSNRAVDEGDASETTTFKTWIAIFVG
jgi:hypothetical protein